MPAKFRCPPGLALYMAELFNGEYDCAFPFDGVPVILDVGACVGAFAIWAEKRWPGAEIHSYEPNPRVHSLLERNVAEMAKPATVHKVAVTLTSEPSVTLYQGRENVGQTSLIADYAGTTDAVTVPARCVVDLPECDILKMDCEGNEPQLLTRYCATHVPPSLVLAEYHSPADMVAFQRAEGYRIIKAVEHTYWRGVVALRRERT